MIQNKKYYDKNHKLKMIQFQDGTEEYCDNECGKKNHYP